MAQDGRQEETLENFGCEYRVMIGRTEAWTDEAKEALSPLIDEKKILKAMVAAVAALLPQGIGLVVEADLLDRCEDQDEYRTRKPACGGPCRVKVVRPIHVGAVD